MFSICICIIIRIYICFNFINNKEATGINDDYMSIKESKLVYLLIEAVKEQQKEIEDLKTELKTLKK